MNIEIHGQLQCTQLRVMHISCRGLTRVTYIVYCVMCAQEQSGVPTLTGPIARRINVANSTGGEEELISAVIPDDVLVKILEERLAVSWLSFLNFAILAELLKMFSL